MSRPISSYPVRVKGVLSPETKERIRKVLSGQHLPRIGHARDKSEGRVLPDAVPPSDDNKVEPVEKADDPSIKAAAGVWPTVQAVMGYLKSSPLLPKSVSGGMIGKSALPLVGGIAAANVVANAGQQVEHTRQRFGEETRDIGEQINQATAAQDRIRGQNKDWRVDNDAYLAHQLPRLRSLAQRPTSGGLFGPGGYFSLTPATGQDSRFQISNAVRTPENATVRSYDPATKRLKASDPEAEFQRQRGNYAVESMETGDVKPGYEALYAPQHTARGLGAEAAGQAVGAGSAAVLSKVLPSAKAPVPPAVPPAPAVPKVPWTAPGAARALGGFVNAAVPYSMLIGGAFDDQKKYPSPGGYRKYRNLQFENMSQSPSSNADAPNNLYQHGEGVANMSSAFRDTLLDPNPIGTVSRNMASWVSQRGAANDANTDTESIQRGARLGIPGKWYQAIQDGRTGAGTESERALPDRAREYAASLNSGRQFEQGSADLIRRFGVGIVQTPQGEVLEDRFGRRFTNMQAAEKHWQKYFPGLYSANPDGVRGHFVDNPQTGVADWREREAPYVPPKVRRVSKLLMTP